MSQAKGYRSQLMAAYETTFGANPTPTAGLVLPFNTCELTGKQTLIDPATITGTRNPSEPVRGRISVDGSLTVPLDFTAIGYWLKGLFGAASVTDLSTKGTLVGGTGVDDTIGTWTAITDGSFKVTINGSASDITGLNFSTDSDMDDVAARIEDAIQAVGTGGFTAATCTYTASTKFFTITSGTKGDASSVALLVAAASGTNISGSSYMKCAASPAAATAGVTSYQHVWKPGTSQPSMVIQKAFPDVSQYFLYNGCKIGSLKLPFGDDSERTVTMDVMGAKQTIAGTTYDGSPTTVTLDRINDFQGSIKEGGATTAEVLSGEVTIIAGLDGSSYCVGANGIRGDIPEGILAVSGTLKTLFQNATLLNKGVNATESSVEAIFANSDASKSLSFLFPEVQYEMTSPAISGPVGVQADLTWKGFYANGSDAACVVVTLKNKTASY